MKIEENFARQQAIFNNRFNSNNSSVTNNNRIGFGEVLGQYINDTNNTLISADSATNAFIRGDDNMSIDEVMIKNQEASLSLQFLTQTRDKLLEGYNTLSNLQL